MLLLTLEDFFSHRVPQRGSSMYVANTRGFNLKVFLRVSHESSFMEASDIGHSSTSLE